MERVLEALIEKKFYLEYRISKYDDMPEIQEIIRKDIKDFEKTINFIQWQIDSEIYNLKTN